MSFDEPRITVWDVLFWIVSLIVLASACGALWILYLIWR